MKRLSDTVNDTECGYCGKKELDLIHSSIAGKKVSALVQCSCRRKDIIIFRNEDLIDAGEFEDADDAADDAAGE